MLGSPIVLVVPARTAMDIDMPAAPKSISGRRPKRSIVKMAIQDAIQSKACQSKDFHGIERPMTHIRCRLRLKGGEP